MSVLCETLAIPHEFVHKGKTYKVSLITQAVQAKFERRLYAIDIEAVYGQKAVLTPEDYQAELKKLREQFSAGEYSFISEKAINFIKTIPGMVMLCSLLFHCDETEIVRLVNERREDVVSLIQLIIQESFPQPTEGEQPEDDTETFNPNA